MGSTERQIEAMERRADDRELEVGELLGMADSAAQSEDYTACVALATLAQAQMHYDEVQRARYRPPPGW